LTQGKNIEAAGTLEVEKRTAMPDPSLIETLRAGKGTFSTGATELVRIAGVRPSFCPER
jgi:hypothetical protein